jgi:hypothetical protein
MQRKEKIIKEKESELCAYNSKTMNEEKFNEYEKLKIKSEINK